MRLLILFPLIASSLSAAILGISSSGSFPFFAPNSLVSAPNGTWAFSFVVDSQPAVSNVAPGQQFDVPFSSFTYMLNGAAVAVHVAEISFFNAANQGFFNLCFNAPCVNFNPVDGFDFFNDSPGGQLYTGLETAPTILTGLFRPNDILLALNGSFVGVQQLSGGLPASNPALVSIAVVPEPSTLLLLTAGLAILTWLRRGTRVFEMPSTEPTRFDLAQAADSCGAACRR